MRQARVGHPQRPCKGCRHTQARVDGYRLYPQMLESPLTAWDRPSRTPSTFPYVEGVSGSRNLGQSWDGNGCQCHQDDEQRVHGTSSCTNKAPEASAAGRGKPAIQVCLRSCRESLISPEVSLTANSTHRQRPDSEQFRSSPRTCWPLYGRFSVRGHGARYASIVAAGLVRGTSHER